jgi:uncharacterized protein (DUF2249 family)
MSNEMIPGPVAARGVERERMLDVRSVLAKGGDPFSLIMKATQALGANEALHLVVGFEPAPLYSVMRATGRLAHTEQRAGVFHVWFWKDPDAKEEGPVELDVRELEPPGPMVAILEKLAALGAGAQLRVRHHREPVLLYDKLELRGYAARVERRKEGDYLILIAPAWALESPPAPAA